MAKTKVTGGYIADSAITPDHLHTSLDISSKTLTIGATTVSGHLIPSANITYDLGSSTYRFRDIYLDGNTIDLGGTELKKNSDGDIEFKSGSNFKKLVISELEFNDGSNRKKFKIDGGRIKTFDSSGASDTADKISLAANTTDDLSEGSSNLYFTNARVDARMDDKDLDFFADVNYTTTPTAGQILVWDNANQYWEPADKDNSDSIAEGSNNLYFTNARARGAISVSGNALSYNSSTGVLTASYEESPVFTGSITVGDSHTIGDDVNDNLEIASSTGENILINSANQVYLQTGGTTKLETTSTGISVTGNIVVSGTVDGRDIATDGTKLDGIEANATADQTQSEINALGITATGLSGTPNITVGTVQATSFSDGTISGVTFIDEDNMASNSATHLATQQSIKTYVDAEVAGVVDSAPAALNTLNELAAALGDDANFSTTTSTALGNRLRVDTASQGLTGTQQANAITNLGITATKAELNYVDGVTSNIQTQLNTKITSSDNITGTAAGLSGTPNITVGTVTSSGAANIDGAVQVGDTVSQNYYGLLQVNQEANNDESGIGILAASAGRSMRIWVDESDSYINSGDGGGGNLIFNEAITVSSAGNLTGVGTISSGAITSTGSSQVGDLTVTGDISLPNATSTIDFGGTGEGGPHGLDFNDDDGSTVFRVYYRTSPNTLTFENAGESAQHTFDLSGNYTNTGDVTVGDLLIMAGGNTKAIAFTGTGSDTNVRHFAYEASDHHYITNRHTNGQLHLMSNNGTGGSELTRITLQAGSGTQDVDITNANLDLNSNNIKSIGTTTTTQLDLRGEAQTSNLDTVGRGLYYWGSTQPSTGSPGFNYGMAWTVRDPNQNIQLAFGSSSAGRLAVRRADSGTYYDWTHFYGEGTTISGDVSSSYNQTTNTLTLTVADDSHNHVISNVDGLQTALDTKYESGDNVSLGTISSGDIQIGSGGAASLGEAALCINVTNKPQLLLDGGNDAYPDIVVPTGEVLQIAHWDVSANSSSMDLSIETDGDVTIERGAINMGSNEVISSSRAISATSVGVTNIVTNKVVKFNGTILDDSNITDTGSAITLGSNTTVSGTISATDITADNLTLLESSGHTTFELGSRSGDPAPGGNASYDFKPGMRVIASDGTGGTGVDADDDIIFAWNDDDHTSSSEGYLAATQTYATASFSKTFSVTSASGARFFAKVKMNDPETVNDPRIAVNGGTEYKLEYADAVNAAAEAVNDTDSWHVVDITDDVVTGTNTFKAWLAAGQKTYIIAVYIFKTSGIMLPNEPYESVAYSHKGFGVGDTRIVSEDRNLINIGTITASGGTSANWNTAYGWGNHASAGYLTGITSSQVTTALGYTPYQESTALSATTGTFSGAITCNGNNIQMTNTQARVKYSVWSSNTYGIGMQTGYTYGGIANEYVMSFQMSNTDDRGFWWGDAGHTNAQGAMALTTDGYLTVANGVRIGYGESDTTHPGTGLDVADASSFGSSVNIDNTLNLDARYDGSQEKALAFKDSGGNYSISHNVNDGNGNYSISLGYKGDGNGQYVVTGDGVGKILFSGHGVDGAVSLNAAQTGTASNDISFTMGLVVDHDSVRVGASADGTGLGDAAGTKVFDASGNAFATSYTLTDNNSFNAWNSDSTGATSTINLPRSGMITFYGNSNADHSIASRNHVGTATDDLRISSYGAVYIDLDANSNNSSNADFMIGHHGSGTGTISELYRFSGEAGTFTIQADAAAGNHNLIFNQQTKSKSMLFYPYTTMGTRYSSWDGWIGQNTSVAKGDASANIELETSYLDSGASGLNVGWSNLRWYHWSSSDLSGKAAGDALTLPSPQFEVDGSSQLSLGGTRIVDSSRNLTNIAAIYGNSASGGTTTFNNGRGAVYFENNGSSNASGAGITLRTSSNPTGDASIFDVRSSGQAVRLFVGQDLSSSGYNPFYVGNANTGTGMGTVNNYTIELKEDGNITAEANITAYGSVSDIRQKENIEQIDQPIERLQKIKGITFNYKKKSEDERLMGVIAQDLLEDDILKLAVYEHEDFKAEEGDPLKHTYGVRYEHLTAVLIEAVKEQQQVINKLTARIEELEK